MTNILLTGGLGYIGSHTAIELINQNHNVIIVDNLANSKLSVLGRLEQITGQKIKFYQADLCDKVALQSIFTENKVEIVIHFAGLKAVGESVAQPLSYYRNNLDSTLTLCEVMADPLQER